MITEALTFVRRRDHLESTCPNCDKGKLRIYHKDILCCVQCGFTCGRFLTKGELLDLLDSEEDELDGAA